MSANMMKIHLPVVTLFGPFPATIFWIALFITMTTKLAEMKDTCDAIPDNDIAKAQTIWNYMQLNHTLQKCAVILALGSYDVRVARTAADLWLGGWGEWLIMSGYTGNLTGNLWTRPEAHIFRDIAIGRGVPQDRILVETESTNTGQNIINIHRLLSSMEMTPSSFLIVQKPYMQRRAYATFLAQWPGFQNSEVHFHAIVTSPEVSMLDYPNSEVGSLSDVISVMLGDMQRIFLYADLGYQVKQHVPHEVEAAFDHLACSGKYYGYFQ